MFVCFFFVFNACAFYKNVSMYEIVASTRSPYATMVGVSERRVKSTESNRNRAVLLRRVFFFLQIYLFQNVY